jgi:hypothetical protein
VLSSIVGLGIFLSQGDDDLGALQEPGQTQEEQPIQEQAVPETTIVAGSQEQLPAAPTEPSIGLGRALEAGLPGLLPDFRDVPVAEVTSFLNQQDIPYLRIDTASSSTPVGRVISQSPEAGASTQGLAQVTLIVSAGSALGPPRTDCTILESTNRRTVEEQAYFEENCGSASAGAADRTDCEEIRGTDYRSPQERTYFLANCVTQ